MEKIVECYTKGCKNTKEKDSNFCIWHNPKKCSYEFCPNEKANEYLHCELHLPKPTPVPITKPVRQEILETAINLTCGDRNKTYGPLKPNLECFSRLVETYLKGRSDVSTPLDATDGAVTMALAKISRIAVNKKHKDNYIDGAAYLAIAGEVSE